MTIGELVTELQKLNPNLLVQSLKIVRDEMGEHVSFALETRPAPEARTELSGGSGA